MSFKKKVSQKHSLHKIKLIFQFWVKAKQNKYVEYLIRVQGRTILACSRNGPLVKDDYDVQQNETEPVPVPAFREVK